MQERLPIPGYDYYYADIYGHIWSNKFNKWRKLKENILMQGKGYLAVSVKENGKIKRMVQVHCLIAITFLGKRLKNRQICHNDGNKFNNKPWNLRYGTAKSNAKDRIKHNKNLPNLKLQTQLF